MNAVQCHKDISHDVYGGRDFLVPFMVPGKHRIGPSARGDDATHSLPRRDAIMNRAQRFAVRARMMAMRLRRATSPEFYEVVVGRSPAPDLTVNRIAAR